MIAYHPAKVVVVDIPGVLIQQMMHLVSVVHHQHQRGDGQFSAGAGGQIALAATGILFEHGDELLHVACLNGLACLAIHFIGILIRGIMREVAADDKQILVYEIGLQHIRYLLQFPEIVR